MNVSTRHNMSIVTLILGRHRTQQALEGLFHTGAPFVMVTSARGTLIQDRWYHSLLPMLSPQLSMFQIAVPDPQVDRVMETTARAARVNRSGGGAIYSTPCIDLHVKGDFPLWPIDEPERPDQDASVGLKENLTAICLISQGERTPHACRAAMAAGSHGPVVNYTEGHGLRDKLGWLRITSKPTKELVSVLVENVDADLVFDDMATAAQVENPARGLIYRMPVQKGLINIDSVYSETRHAASIPQIIRAIDEIQGSRQWRQRDDLVGSGGALAGIRSSVAPAPSQDHERTLLSLTVDRQYAGSVTQSLLGFGVPGVNIEYLQLRSEPNEPQHPEVAHMRCVLDQSQAKQLESQVLEEINHPMMVTTHIISKLRTYRRPTPKPQNKRWYRGAAVP